MIYKQVRSLSFAELTSFSDCVLTLTNFTVNTGDFFEKNDKLDAEQDCLVKGHSLDLKGQLTDLDLLMFDVLLSAESIDQVYKSMSIACTRTYLLIQSMPRPQYRRIMRKLYFEQKCPLVELESTSVVKILPKDSLTEDSVSKKSLKNKRKQR